jgi:hypothetical protein
MSRQENVGCFRRIRDLESILFMVRTAVSDRAAAWDAQAR